MIGAAFSGRSSKTALNRPCAPGYRIYLNAISATASGVHLAIKLHRGMQHPSDCVGDALH
jgi:hypothetical protein